GVGDYLAGVLRRSTGFALPVTGRPAAGAITLALSKGVAGPEAYRLDVTAGGVKLTARSAQGLFRGVQTLRQLFPAKVEAASAQPGPWVAPGVRIADAPRFAWRGAHLDVSRHFFGVGTVKRYIDLIALYKINVLHLHLSDDQGWRITVDSWPRLTTFGGSTQVGGGPGGFYTKADYAEIVRYATSRHMTVVPEIDTPGHTNAALASYAELNCDGVAPPLYTGIEVGFSSLCIPKEVTYRFLDDVTREVAAQNPAKTYHVGGDEAHSTAPADYVTFIDRMQGIVHEHDRTMMGWVDIARGNLKPGAIAQYWYPDEGSAGRTDLAREAKAKGAKIVMSPANKAYLDMKYDANTPLGLSWAGFVEVADSYQWDPATLVDGVGESDVLGVEAPLWSETLLNIDHIEFMAFPRLPGIAEIGWSPASGRSFDEYRLRLAAQGPRWANMSVDFYRSPQVPWS
ncbi:MAG: beta-N-acetylhexosaminidase, partial [Stackebrandtia sp.]